MPAPFPSGRIFFGDYSIQATKVENNCTGFNYLPAARPETASRRAGAIAGMMEVALRRHSCSRARCEYLFMTGSPEPKTDKLPQPFSGKSPA